MATTKILDADGRQLFQEAVALRVTVTREAKVMEHPIETGATIVDHMVVQPIKIELALILTAATYKAVYASLAAAYLAGKLLTVQTRADSFVNMLIERIPHEETPEQFDILPVAVTLREVKLITPTYTRVKVNPKRNPKSAGTKKKGETQSTEVTASNGGSTLGKGYKGLKDWASGFFKGK